MRRILIVGASVAGVHAAEALREYGFDGEVVLVGAERHLPYDRPPLSKDNLKTELDSAELQLRPGEWYDQRDVQLRLGVAAHGLDTRSQILWLGDGTALEYDGIVLATGSAPRRPAGIDGDSAGVCLLRTMEDSVRLRQRLIPGSRLVLIGAGFIGMEIASAARARDVEVTIVEIGAAPLERVFGTVVGTWFARLHERHGTDVRCDDSVRSVRRDGTKWVVQLGSGDDLRADTVAAGLGAVPSTDWLQDSGLDLVRGGVCCDENLRAGPPGVVVAGDIAHWHNTLFDESMRIEHWTNAVEQGRHAALSLLGLNDQPYTGPPYFWTDQYDAGARTIGPVAGSDQVHVHHADGESLVALYGRGSQFRGALCINAPRTLLACRRALTAKASWEDALDLVSG